MVVIKVTPKSSAQGGYMFKWQPHRVTSIVGQDNNIAGPMQHAFGDSGDSNHQDTMTVLILFLGIHTMCQVKQYIITDNINIVC